MKRGEILTPGVWWGPVVDGTELPSVPLHAFQSGEFAHVPLIIGWNRDEGMLHPGTEALPWPRYSRATEQQLVFDLAPSVAEHVKQRECDLWDSVEREPKDAVARVQL